MDIFEAQKRLEKLVDPSKTCETCLNTETPGEKSPCSECINGFMDIPFNPSHWKER